MSEIQIKRTVANNQELSKVVNNEFSTFTGVVETDLLTVEEFFIEYDRLFYDIPAEGDTNSHTYLALRSSEQANLAAQTQDIQPLLDEIANLRERLLEANVTIASLQGT